MRILICGAGGNLGGHLARHLLDSGHELTLMWHHHPPREALAQHPRARAVQADLADQATLAPALEGSEVAVHLAGMLFAPRPAAFLYQTNVVYLQNLVEVSKAARLRRLVFVSFPQVEGPSTPDHPSRGRLEGSPVSVHASTRLEAERQLFSMCDGARPTPVVVRSGTVYGRRVRLIEVARRLMAWRFMAIWHKPTWYHFIALPDFLAGLEAAATLPDLHGIYPLGDDSPMSLQAFVDRLARHWGYRPPWRLPVAAFEAGAFLTEAAALILRTRSPLTRDFLRLARVDHVMDTSRMKSELLPGLRYPSLADGLAIL